MGKVGWKWGSGEGKGRWGEKGGVEEWRRKGGARKRSGERGWEEESHTFQFCQLESSAEFSCNYDIATYSVTVDL